MPEGSEQRSAYLPAGVTGYRLRLSRRATRLRLSVRCDASVVVSVPARFPGDPAAAVERFLRDHAAWLVRAVRAVRARTVLPVRTGRRDYRAKKEEARALVRERLAVLNGAYGFPVRAVAIRNQRTRWGSCSRTGRLNFNYRLIYLPPALCDYVIAHELCHLKEFNHSPRFWALVARTVADVTGARRALKRIAI